jgi:hypothetical protein
MVPSPFIDPSSEGASMHRTAGHHERDLGAGRHRGPTLAYFTVALLGIVLTTDFVVIGTRAEGPRSPWPSWVLEDRLARADVVAVARWDEPSGAAIYEMPGARRVYIRRTLNVSRVFVGTLPRHASMLVGGGACFDHKMKRYFLDEQEAVDLPPDTGQFTLFLKHLTGRDYELVDGPGGVLKRLVDGSGNETAFITTRRSDLVLSENIVPAKTPSPDVVAARVSIDQLGAILERLQADVHRDRHAEASSTYRARDTDAVDRKTIVEDLAATADRLIAARTGEAFFRQHLVRQENPQWIPSPIGGPHVHQPSEEWRGIGVSYRLRAFGKTFEQNGMSVVIGPDRSIVGADRAPDCSSDDGACEFRFDQTAAERIAREQGFAEGRLPWQTNLHWEASCGAFVWSIMNSLSDRESQVILVTSGAGTVCGKQSITSISSGVPRPDVGPPPPSMAPSRPTPGVR